MPWLDDLKRLRVRVDNEGYGKQMADVAERRTLLERFAGELAVEGMMGEMNDILLDGGARCWWTGRGSTISMTMMMRPGPTSWLTRLSTRSTGTTASRVEIEVRVGIDDEDAGYVIVEDEEVDLDGRR